MPQSKQKISLNIQGRSSNLEVSSYSSSKSTNVLKYGGLLGLVFLVGVSCCVSLTGGISQGDESFVSNRNRRLASTTPSPNLVSVFTQQAFSAASSAAVTSDETVGMFFYIKDDGKFVGYDTSFQTFATIKYNLVKGSGSTLGHVTQCSASVYAEFSTQPELKGVPANMLFCAPIDFAKEI